jgi:uncharacterized membrane protein YphA (DoxX/SURF4 family)
VPNNFKEWVIFILRLVAAGILLQTLFFKFSGSPESKFIFGTLGIEPWGRWLSGVAELVASILLLIPATQLLGAALAMGIMLGAIASHVLILGFVVQDDGGLLFTLACTVFVSSSVVVFFRREQIPMWINRIKNVLLVQKAK